MTITFSTCFYIIKSKFDASTYVYWMNNFISIVNHFNLVIYTDQNSIKYIDTKNNPRIKVILKSFEEFYNYKYKEYWLRNHEKNVYLNQRVDWSVNMLWSEKIQFVKETLERKYFITDYYGWCDVGYFRNRSNDIHSIYLSDWSNSEKISALDKTKIHYACVNNDSEYITQLTKQINTKNEKGLPSEPIPPIQQSIAGGFFIAHKEMIPWWSLIYDTKVINYFEHGYLVKDDQVVLANCILDNDLNRHFQLYYENISEYDHWFMFQRILN